MADADMDAITDNRVSGQAVSTSAHNWVLTVWIDKLISNEFVIISEQVREAHAYDRTSPTCHDHR